VKRALVDCELEQRRVSADAAALARDREGDTLKARQVVLAAEEALKLAQLKVDACRRASRQERERVVAREAEHAQRERQVQALPAAEAKAELSQLEREVAALPTLPPELEESARGAEAAVVSAEAELERLTAELSRVEGALGHVGGEVVEERERRAQEALTRSRDLERDLERQYDAYALLTNTLKAVESEQGTHLGRALEAPISQRLSELTGGRYGSVGIGSALGTRGVVVSGVERSATELSEGTQEQLATLLRVCIAEQLGAGLVLDDHLAQTHRNRAAWFSAYLREVTARIQVIVITARPEDYLSAEEMPASDAVAACLEGGVCAVDLERAIARATYSTDEGPGPVGESAPSSG
jgi:hypothetical protein